MRILVGATALLLLALPAMAGTADDPEVIDPANDMTYRGVVPVMQPPAGVTVGLNSDLLAAWIEDVGDALRFTARVQGTAAPTTTSSSIYTFSFDVGGQTYLATVHVGAAAPVGTGAVTAGGVAVEATSANSLVTATVPKSNIGSPQPGAVVSGFFVDVEGRLFDEVDEFTVDRAPDTGAGREFILPGATASSSFVAVDATELDIGNVTHTAANATVQYNWTAPMERVQLTIAVNGTAGVVAINITAAGWGNGTQGGPAVYACECNGSIVASVPAEGVGAMCVDEQIEPIPCTFTIRIGMRSFVGSWSITSTAVPPAGPGATGADDASGSASGSPSGNATGNATAPLDEKGAPLPWLVPTAAVVLAAVRRRW